ncbi:nicotinate-nucleotide adenylyltransferase [Aestuariicoccus sp. MJ-SS9]|uniref:nicotinate-nucleotide adenylyltransferase n=1 Tax=Aestuariicoccus sp. MJ-SS9 TaxID=3079855 RepID=UPI0029093C32|nr:nicotinate-nucleotide adenylyltransferase [Aestuariicoccus sp. MJ-SS9]MDU8912420.1 nicotinate-nucleotide adenylyltransferase [Aestuariicoccus sp. MJ-SS9]
MQDQHCCGQALRLPLPRGARVGLLGGSFNPAHAGHVHISKEALRRFGLDRVVWLVSPMNPLKTQEPASLADRMDKARQVLGGHPRICVSDFESRADTRYTAETLALLRRLHPGISFVWLMGADNLAQIHRWRDWQKILNDVPVGVLARPGDRISGRMSKAARVFRCARLSARASRLLPAAAPPAWCFVNVPMIPLSSTRIRAAGHWPAAMPLGRAGD